MLKTGQLIYSRHNKAERVLAPLPVGKQAKLLGISRGTVYYLPRATRQAGLALMRQIDELHLEHPFMGQQWQRPQPLPPL